MITAERMFSNIKSIYTGSNAVEVATQENIEIFAQTRRETYMTSEGGQSHCVEPDLESSEEGSLTCNSPFESAIDSSSTDAPTTVVSSEAHIWKNIRVDDSELRQPQFDKTICGEAHISKKRRLSNTELWQPHYDDVPFQPPQIHVSPTFSSGSQSCEAFMAQFNTDVNLQFPAQSVYDAARVPAPAPVPVLTPSASTFTFDSEVLDTLTSDSPGPWEADWTLFGS